MEKLIFDKAPQIQEKINRLRKTFNTHKTIETKFRIKQLTILKASIKKYENEIDEANRIDLGHSKFVSFFAGTAGMLLEIDHMIQHLEEWAAPRYVDTPVAFAPASSYIVPEPHGLVLIMGAWNFQLPLSIVPLATSIAAGNVSLVKPSEMAPASALILEKIIGELDQDIVQVTQGAQETCEALLRCKFDLIFFTGSPMKGKLVAKAAAEFLTPCILELGGQNPCIVDKTASITNAALNLCYGRFFNSGQVCIGAEYVLVEESMKDKLVTELKKTVIDFFGQNPKESEDYTKMINPWHTERVSKLCTTHGGKLICGGDFNINDRYISPTIIEFDSIEKMSKSSVAEGEIFGPILYLVTYKNLSTAIDYINSKDKPLALYYFGNDKASLNSLIKNTSSGAIMTNDTIVHYGNSSLPFGGVGTSGYGSYHGKWGFDNLSHLKPIMDRSQTTLRMRYPPFKGNEKIMRFMLNNLNYTQAGMIRFVLFTIVFGVSIYYRNCLLSGANSAISFGHAKLFK